MINHILLTSLHTYLSILSLSTRRTRYNYGTRSRCTIYYPSGNDLAVKEKIVPDKSTRAVEDKPSK